MDSTSSGAMWIVILAALFCTTGKEIVRNIFKVSVLIHLHTMHDMWDYLNEQFASPDMVYSITDQLMCVFYFNHLQKCFSIMHQHEKLNILFCEYFAFLKLLRWQLLDQGNSLKKNNEISFRSIPPLFGKKDQMPQLTCFK